MNRHTPPTAVRPIARRVLEPLARYLHVEAASGSVLLVCTLAALIWTNSPWSSTYEALWHEPLTLRIGSLVSARPLHFWVNDGLMTIFFLVVGLEIRRELHDGALTDFRLALLPIAAALGGVLAPALIYISLNTEPALRRGWGVPMATDIAFAVGVLALLGARVPAALRVLLLTLAIVDDIAAILAIAVFYSNGIAVAGLLLSGAGVIAVLALQRAGVLSAFAYVIPGVVVWYGMLRAGIHPTLAGVVLGLLAPATPAGARERVEATLHPWVAYAIMPLFALANAGIPIAGFGAVSEHGLSVGIGIIAGLVLGKPLGILLASWIAVKVGVCRLPTGITWRHLGVLGTLGGVGFTMSIFIANLAFSDAALLRTAKLAVLVASAVAAIAGLLLGRRACAV